MELWSRAMNVATFVTFKNLVILCRRIDFCPINKVKVPFGGFWSPFCGAIESGEDPEIAAAREVWEESKIWVNEKDLIPIEQLDDIYVFEYKLKEMEPVELNFEHTEYGYFKISQLNCQPEPIDQRMCNIIMERHNEN